MCRSTPSALLSRANHASIDRLDAGLLVWSSGFVLYKRNHHLSEDRKLTRELEGYADYAAHVRYRLSPSFGRILQGHD
jgi:hypothetical protein